MYCATCAAPLSPGLSYCNRCGVNLKEREDPKKDTVNAYLTTIFVLGLAGLGLMLGGSIALKNGAQFHEGLIGIFMLMTFLIIGIVEIYLCRQLSRIIGDKAKTESLGQQSATTAELPAAHLRGLGAPVASVTENTTRTLEYSSNEQTR